MRIVLVSSKEELRDIIRSQFSPHGTEIIQYLNPIKAMDNLDEIDPDVVLFSAEDFPRHWKPFLAFLRQSKGRETGVFVLMKGDSFTFEEASKAQALEVNGIVREDLSDAKELLRLKELVQRYKETNDLRQAKRYVPDELDKIEFLFTHPTSFSLVTGNVEDVSSLGLSFTPDTPEDIDGLTHDTVIPACSLRVGDDILSFSARVVRNDRRLSVTYISLDEPERELIDGYIDKRGERELQADTNRA
jgi:hypothetical protein